MVAIDVRTPITAHDRASETRRRKNPLSIVDAAYDLEAGEIPWVEGVVKAAVPIFDLGAGLVGFCWAHEPGFVALHVSNPVFLGCDPRLPDAMTRAAVESSPALQRRIYTGPPCGSAMVMSDSVGDPRPNALESVGVFDVLSVHASEAGNIGFSLLAPTGKRTQFPSRLSATMSRVARHIAAARRLRQAVHALDNGRTSLDAAAVLDPTGRVLHAEGEAEPKRERSTLAAAARLLEQARDRSGSDPEQALRLWTALVDGRWSLIRSEDSDGKRLLLVRRNTPDLPEPLTLTPDERHVLSLFARGHSPGLVAYELGLPSSTVTDRLHGALKKLGLRSRAELLRIYGPLAPRG